MSAALPIISPSKLPGHAAAVADAGRRGALRYLGEIDAYPAAEAHVVQMREATSGILAPDAAITHFKSLSSLGRAEHAVQCLIRTTQHAPWPTSPGVRQNGNRRDLAAVQVAGAMLRQIKYRPRRVL